MVVGDCALGAGEVAVDYVRHGAADPLGAHLRSRETAGDIERSREGVGDKVKIMEMMGHCAPPRRPSRLA